MKNNDPIKDYNPAALRLERMAEKLEMYLEKDAPVTDLHDCSNDLSDAGSRKEEYEHSEFAKKARKIMDEDSNFQNIKKFNVSSNNLSTIITIVIIIVFILIKIFGIIFEFITDYAEIFLNDFLDEYNYEYQDNYQDMYQEFRQDIYQEFSQNNHTISYLDYKNDTLENYKKNVSIKTHEMEDNKFILEIYNSNSETYQKLFLNAVFYDENRNIIEEKVIDLNILISENYHFLEIPDVPTNYAKYEYDITDCDGNYIAISNENISLKHREKGIFLQNNSGFSDLELVEVVVAFMYENKVVNLKKYQLENVPYGEEIRIDFDISDVSEKFDDCIITINKIID